MYTSIRTYIILIQNYRPAIINVFVQREIDLRLCIIPLFYDARTPRNKILTNIQHTTITFIQKYHLDIVKYSIYFYDAGNKVDNRSSGYF